MPFYEYECRACGAHHEAMQKMSDAALKKCPACGKSRLVRLISAPVFRLKGGGWYETDFKSDKEGKRNLHGEDKADSAPATTPAAEGKAAAKADGGAEANPAPTKSEAKPEAKPEAKSEAKSEAKPARPSRRTTAPKRVAKLAKPAARGIRRR